MTRPGAAAKYYTVHARLDDAQLAAHLASNETYAAPLIGRDGLAGAGVIELDVGAEAGARSALEALAAAGVTAFSIATPGSGGHNGSHTWALYRARGDPEAIKDQLRQAALSADLPSREIFPSNQCIRLPFGLHRRTRRRGALLLQDGRRFDLDAGQLAEAIAAVLALQRNPLPAASLPPARQVPARQAPARPALSGADVIGEFCRVTDLADLLAGYPGYHIVSRSAGGAILRCGCPHHRHGDKRPSLEVKRGRHAPHLMIPNWRPGSATPSASASGGGPTLRGRAGPSRRAWRATVSSASAAGRCCGSCWRSPASGTGAGRAWPAWSIRPATPSGQSSTPWPT